MHPSASVLIPALRTVGNIVTGDDLQTQVCLLLHPAVAMWIEPEYVLSPTLIKSIYLSALYSFIC